MESIECKASNSDDSFTSNHKSNDKNKVVRIGNAGGYWGDDPFALRRQVQGSLKLDYIMIDYLAELTMSILQKQQSRDPSLGYAKDFITTIEPLLEECLKKNIVIVTNAGGINPKSCTKALLSIANKKNLKLKVATVEGDSFISDIKKIREEGALLDNLETQENFDKYTSQVLCANAYIGADPIVEALKHKPDIVICGRVTDSSLTLAPMMYEFNWKSDDYNELAHGIVAGHLLECGAQATGGNFTDWKKVPSFINIGFPIVECFADGSFILTKQPGSGGFITDQTVREQLLYETFDPAGYMTPDVIADFTTIKLEDYGDNRVKISDVQGRPPTDKYKASLAYKDGYKCSGTIIVSGPDAYAKAKVFETLFWERLDNELELAGFSETFVAKQTEFIGDDSTHKGILKEHISPEILLRLGARDYDKNKLALFRKFLPSLILSGPCGVAVTGGAPSISDVVSFWPALVPKKYLSPFVEVFHSSKGAAHD